MQTDLYLLIGFNNKHRENMSMKNCLNENVPKLVKKLTRTKTLDSDAMDTPLKRSLGTLDISLIGIGSMVGSGIFVMSGTVVKNIAGPAAVVSFLIAGLAAVLAAFCYAEFASRVSKTGSAYTYTYIIIGELMAFIIGWDVLLELTISLAALGRAFSGTLDSLFADAIKNGTQNAIGKMQLDWLSYTPDFVAALVVLIITAVVALGTSISTKYNKIFCSVNILCLIAIFGVAFYFADFDNWENKEHGGFLPYGVSGVISGASVFFYSYVGFEQLASAAEEAIDPAKSMPRACCIAVATAITLYCVGGSALTLMLPFYEVDPSRAFSSAFDTKGLPWLEKVIAVVILMFISVTLLNSCYGLSRNVYAMASDGLLFKFLAKVNHRTQTPIFAIAVFGILSSVLALLFDIQSLAELVSIGSLQAYIFVAISIIIIRYQPMNKCQFELKQEDKSIDGESKQISALESTQLLRLKKLEDRGNIGQLKERWKGLYILKNTEPGKAVLCSTILMSVSMLSVSALVLLGTEYLRTVQWWAVMLLVIFTTLIVVCYLIIIVHEQNTRFLTYQMPLVPFIPACSILINCCLVVKLRPSTWIRYCISLAIGLIIYFTYGIRQSNENRALSTDSQMVSYSELSNEANESMNSQDTKPESHTRIE
ncbi:unnamed protein product [Owenia fusiformis]|uniref:Uncharacterized protein n=1 Tax=Owenia fusiformis TaxID=6347 RepID=A0A8J1YAA4_OWEFU|nr:unnamed protein product [Owenia fusiformis]